ncbi:MAG: DUF4097 family beta strand repeat-containing protein [Cyclobacteriaceae bacterium]
MNRITLLFLMVLVAMAGCNPFPLHPISDIEEGFDGVKEVIVKGGALEVSYRGGPEAQKVYLNAFVEASDESIDGIIYHRSGDQLIVEFDPEINFSFLFGHQVKGFISITGPEEMALNMDNSSGKLEVENVRNEKIVLKASSGKLEARNLHSPNLDIRASSGMIDLEDLEGHLNLKISSGMASLDGMKGDVVFRGSSGLVNLERIEGMVSGKMSSGKANLSHVTTLGEISLSSGMLEAENCGLGETTYLEASSGYMKVTSTTDLEKFNFDFSVGSGRLTIGNRSSSENLYIDNGSSSTIKGKLQSGKLDLREL